MIFFARCAGVFFLCWIIFFFVVHSMWSGEFATSASLLFGGVMSIVAAVIYGLFDEMWLQHRQY